MQHLLSVLWRNNTHYTNSYLTCKISHAENYIFRRMYKPCGANVTTSRVDPWKECWMVRSILWLLLLPSSIFCPQYITIIALDKITFVSHFEVAEFYSACLIIVLCVTSRQNRVPASENGRHATSTVRVLYVHRSCCSWLGIAESARIIRCAHMAHEIRLWSAATSVGKMCMQKFMAFSVHECQFCWNQITTTFPKQYQSSVLETNPHSHSDNDRSE